MNINSNELLLLAKKNIKFRGEAAPAPQSVAVTEPTETNPQSGLSALEAQGQSNIAFQGVKIPAQLKNKGLGAMMALSLFTATSLTSCDDSDDPKVVQLTPGNVEQTVIVDLSAITEMMNAMMTMWNQMIEQQKLTNEQLILLNTQMTSLMTQYQQGQIDANEFYSKMYDFMFNNAANQQAIISLLINNGKSEAEAQKYLNDILNVVKEGNLTSAEAWEKILTDIGDIKVSLTEIKAKLDAIQKQMTANHEEYLVAKDEELKYLANIYDQGNVRKEQLDELLEKVSSADAKLANIEQNTKDMIALIKDDKNFNELKEILKGLKPADIDYAKFEEMFKIYGLGIQDVIKMSAADIEAILKDYLTNYLANEAKQNELIASIGDKLNTLNLFPGLDSESLQNALAALEKAINNNTDSVTGELGDIQAQLDKIQKTLDNMLKELGSLSSQVSTYNKIFADNWQTAIGKLDNLNIGLKNIQTAQQVSNEHLANIDENTKNLKEAQVLANGYLAALLNKTGEIKDLIAELETNSNGGMTIDEFKAYMQERDKAQYEQFVQFTVDMGFDKLPGDVSTIKDLLSAMNNKIQNLKDYSGQLETIIGKLDKLADFLKNADFSNPDYTAKLDKIIDLLGNLDFTLECNCEHTCDHAQDKVDTNEGIIGDIGDIFG